MTDRFEHLTSLINRDFKILLTTGENKPPFIVDKWLPN